MTYILDRAHITLGVCYYPEHWDRESWAGDLDRMKQAGIQVVRVAEFAWSITEPEEGVFDFSFWDAFLDLAEKKGVKVIFGTPTATPPVWLTEKYPEALNADIDGHLMRHGARRHYNYNSPVYQRLCARIVETLAAHVGRHPAIIGWQIDNEMNCEKDEFYSESDTVAFRTFLRAKYGDIGSLNKAWGTVFWNQTYNGFEQVYVPRTTNGHTNNPHHMLDFYRFVSDSACRFAKLQADILRKHIKPNDFITTNGMFGNIDYMRMRRESLDFITYDSYPNFAYCLDDYKVDDRLKDRRWSKNLAEARAVSPIFGVMEQQSGANGWNTCMDAPTPREGQITLWTMQSVAHGADFISYFRWRTCTFGTEIYWHGILDYSGRDNRRLREVTEVGRKLQALQALAGARYEARVAILRDADNIMDARIDVWHGRMERRSMDALLEACQLTHTPFDYVNLTAETRAEQFSAYDVAFYPHACILGEEQVALLTDYVNAGGRLVLGCRAGFKDRNGHCVAEPLPGLLRGLTGVDIPEYSLVAPDEAPSCVLWDGERIEAAVFNDELAPACASAEVLATYESPSRQQAPALIRNRFGKGEVYSFGGAFAYDTAAAFLTKLDVASPYASLLELPESCELAVREKDGQRYCFVLNYASKACAVTLKRELLDMLTLTPIAGRVDLPAYGVLLLKDASGGGERVRP